jgi:hypothetical protein
MEYLTFVTNLNELPEGKEVNLFVKDLKPGQRKYATRYVKATVSRSPAGRSDKLWVRFHNGALHPEPLGIRIVSELGPYPVKN